MNQTKLTNDHRSFSADPAGLADPELLMRMLVFLAMITPLVLLPACSRVTPTASPERTLPPSPVPTATPVPPTPTQQAMPTPEPTATQEPTPTPSSEPTPTPVEATPTPEPAEECVVESCEPYQEIALYHGFSDEQPFSRLVPGTNKTLLVKDRRDGRMLIEVTEPSGAKWEAWADDDPGAYGPVGEAPRPPTPEAPPPVHCEAPHFGGRTPDRKTGSILMAVGPIQQIFPERGRYHFFRWAPDSPWVMKRDGRIVAIDQEDQIITFDVGNGLIVQRKFTQNAQVIMLAHDLTQEMPVSQARQIGGNFCDLEVGDAAAILHPNEAEGANPSLEGNLWGVVFVQ